MHAVLAAVLSSLVIASSAAASSRATSHDAPETPWAQLMTATTPAAAHSACDSAVFVILRQRSAAPGDDARALEALIAYARSRRPAEERGWCLVNARNLVTWNHDAAAARALERAEDALLASPSGSDQLAAAEGMRGQYDARESLPLLRLALPARARRVRVAALDDLFAPMRAALAVYGTSALPYESVIAMAERSPDPAIVAAGFRADGSLRGPAAGATLERALDGDPRPAVRVAALEALDDRQVSDELTSRMIDRGLRDRDAAVREAAMDQMEMIFIPSADEERRIATLARSAPTPAERNDARASLVQVRRDRRNPSRLRYVRSLEHSRGV